MTKVEEELGTHDPRTKPPTYPHTRRVELTDVLRFALLSYTTQTSPTLFIKLKLVIEGKRSP